MRVRTRLPWVLDEITAPVEKQFGPSPMDGKTEQAASPLREDSLAFFHGDVEEWPKWPEPAEDASGASGCGGRLREPSSRSLPLGTCFDEATVSTS